VFRSVCTSDENKARVDRVCQFAGLISSQYNRHQYQTRSTEPDEAAQARVFDVLRKKIESSKIHSFNCVQKAKTYHNELLAISVTTRNREQQLL